MRIMAVFFGTISEERVLLKILGGLYRLVLYFRAKNVIFLNPFLGLTSKIHTRFQTWPLGKNYVIT